METTAPITATPPPSGRRQVPTDWLIDRVRANIRILKSLRKLTDEKITTAGGFSSRQVVSHRLSGRSDMSADDFARFAAALNVEPHVLMMSNEDALRWASDHPGFKAPRYKPQPPNSNKARGAEAARAAKKRNDAHDRRMGLK